MISVVNTNGTATMSNPYSGMSLSEACESFMLETNNIANDLEMNILLNEHLYLYENGVEISYVNEDGEVNGKGKELLEKVKMAWEQFAQKVSNLWDSLITHVTEFGNKVLQALLKAGINKDDAIVATKVLKDLDNDKLPLFKGKTVKYDYQYLEKYFNNAIVSPTNGNSPDDYKPIKAEDMEYNVTSEAFARACSEIFDKKFTLKEIRKAKDEANKAFKKVIGDLKKSDEDYSKILESSKNCINTNNRIMKDAIKAYNTKFAETVSIVRLVFGNAEVKKVIRDRKSAAIKEAPKKVGNALKNAPKNLADSLRKKTVKADSATNESAYDGKYFRV